MRIALTIYGTLDTLSGGYLYDRKMVEALHAAGHEVEVLALPWRNYLRHLSDNLSPAWLRTLRDARVDLHLQDELCHPSLAWANARAMRTSSAPVLSIVHHLRSSEEHPRLVRPFYSAVERRYLRGVDGLLCNSRTTLASVYALTEVAVPGEVVFPAGDHLEIGNLLSLHEIEGAFLSILFVGNLSPRKQLHTLLLALAQMHFPARLTVVGSEDVDPAYSRRIHRLVTRLDLTQHVTFAGRVSDETLRTLYGQSHVLALPSYEGFGITYLEAMARGRPVIASTAGAAHEIVTDGIDGFLVPPGDADLLAQRLDQLAADRDLLTTMGEQARLRYERQPTWQESGARFVRFVEEFAR